MFRNLAARNRRRLSLSYLLLSSQNNPQENVQVIQLEVALGQVFHIEQKTAIYTLKINPNSGILNLKFLQEVS
jgi:hypothetical protein